MIKFYDLLKSLINGVLLIISFFLVLTVLFLAFSANQGTPMVAWVLAVGGALSAPFVGIAPNLPIGTGVLDTVAIVALVLYLLIGYLVLAVVDSLTNRTLRSHYTTTAHYHDIDQEEEDEEVVDHHGHARH